MRKPEPKLTRSQLRVWLKWVLQSSLLERLPPRYDAEEVSRSSTPEEVARRLLAGLQDPELCGRTRALVVADIQQFRDWVHARQKASRQIILSEIASTHHGPDLLEDRAAAMSSEYDHSPSPMSPRRLMPRSDPMWEEDLDG